MARSDDDTWDPASSVGATATLVAAARAAATRRPQPVIDDPFAEPLVRAVGIDLFNRVAAGELDNDGDDKLGIPRMTDTFGARARFFDDFFAQATHAGIRQVVIVAAGLDSRGYRLSWPAGTTVYEIDQPEVIEFKTSTLSKIGAKPTAEHRPVSIDLREDWPAALRDAGFDAAQPTAWLAEGVLIGFLPPEAEVRLLDNVISLSAKASRFAADYGSVTGSVEDSPVEAQKITDALARQGLNLDYAELIFFGEHTDIAAHLQERGWDVLRFNLAELFTAAGLPALRDAAQRGPVEAISFVTAVLK
ncbi:class I SAM-dependent methyltransferase [Mycobacterium montefiorense]|uniref:S-adenosyl-L-methionine-dependent methyltransferase n=1 Tax=Mycobacterium montefiorense TaxID=154654 RepID=A0AA37PLN3_9MYCO|nr:class I SAM-dependent methyltransferase [Mycobacterium montefiorense]GBG39976.1 putative S-adenosyl-L-methionine-dependent methyltransferase [Mycobacterium montefiorense]GKU33665.1 putative S-adenosyl-L-methionine-dependent methyltransferase [Mycobacterium montefiorense]GKU39601.1 putative S-adenosyl-L-methionine-dependent methyltransferase [Mycobacterium montefiorense]GKU43878.1 putative S-adenosyl-L-methionine-dependent methyltransferase [Mycobacterium montefiorense]GKU52630.1 putative S-